MDQSSSTSAQNDADNESLATFDVDGEVEVVESASLETFSGHDVDEEVALNVPAVNARRAVECIPREVAAHLEAIEEMESGVAAVNARTGADLKADEPHSSANEAVDAPAEVNARRGVERAQRQDAAHLEAAEVNARRGVECAQVQDAAHLEAIEEVQVGVPVVHARRGVEPAQRADGAQLAAIEEAEARLSAHRLAQLGPVEGQDVLCNRGESAKRFNEHYRRLVKSFVPAFAATQTDALKAEMAREIVRNIQSAGGRFLCGRRGVVLSNDEARAKVTKALNDYRRRYEQAGR